MRNIKNLEKIANLVTMFVVLALLVVPVFADAQFRLPGGPGSSDPTGGTIDSASELVISIINILLAIAGLIAVIFLIVGGFRYITAGGNEEAAESAKKTILNAIIGIVVIILAFVIVRVISNALVRGSSGV